MAASGWSKGSTVSLMAACVVLWMPSSTNTAGVSEDHQFAGVHARHNAATLSPPAPLYLSPAAVVPRRGDHNLRSSYGSRMLDLMQSLPASAAPGQVQAVLDLGCATGLSSLALTQLFPAAHVTGVDLSPHMVAVGRYHQEKRQVGVVARHPPQAMEEVKWL